MSDSSWALVGKAINDFDGVMWEVSGPQFLAMYAGWFVLIFGMVLILRWCGLRNPAFTIVGLVGFEIPAALRMTIFAPPYMHQWFFLAVAMLLGGTAFLRGIRCKKPPK